MQGLYPASPSETVWIPCFERRVLRKPKIEVFGTLIEPYRILERARGQRNKKVTLWIPGYDSVRNGDAGGSRGTLAARR